MNVLRYVPEIAELVNEFRSTRLLAYLCGRGFEYRRERVHVVFGVNMPILYDSNFAPFNAKPIGQFDGVICCGALDNISSDGLKRAVNDIEGYAKQWAFIATSHAIAQQIVWKGGARLVLKETK